MPMLGLDEVDFNVGGSVTPVDLVADTSQGILAHLSRISEAVVVSDVIRTGLVEGNSHGLRVPELDVGCNLRYIGYTDNNYRSKVYRNYSKSSCKLLYLQ